MADSYITGGANDLGASGVGALITWFGDTYKNAKKNRFTSVLKLINNDLSPMVAEKGSAINVPIYTTTTARDLTDGNAIVKDNDVGSKQTVTLSGLKYCAFGQTEVAAALSGNMAYQGMLENRIAGLINAVQEDVLSLAPTLSTNEVGTFNTDITKPVLVAATGKLFAAKAPGPFYGVLRDNAHSWQAFAQLAEIVNVYQRGGVVSPMMTDGTGYDLVPAWGVNYGVSTGAYVTSSNTSNMIFSRDAIVFASRGQIQPMSPNVISENIVDEESGLVINIKIAYDLNYQSDLVTVSCLYGKSLAREDWACEIKA